MPTFNRSVDLEFDTRITEYDHDVEVEIDVDDFLDECSPKEVAQAISWITVHAREELTECFGREPVALTTEQIAALKNASRILIALQDVIGLGDFSQTAQRLDSILIDLDPQAIAQDDLFQTV